jgi:hypothetical protein
VHMLEYDDGWDWMVRAERFELRFLGGSFGVHFWIL